MPFFSGILDMAIYIALIGKGIIAGRVNNPLTDGFGSGTVFLAEWNLEGFMS